MDSFRDKEAATKLERDAAQGRSMAPRPASGIPQGIKKKSQEPERDAALGPGPTSRILHMLSWQRTSLSATRRRGGARLMKLVQGFRGESRKQGGYCGYFNCVLSQPPPAFGPIPLGAFVEAIAGTQILWSDELLSHPWRPRRLSDLSLSPGVPVRLWNPTWVPKVCGVTGSPRGPGGPALPPWSFVEAIVGTPICGD